VEIELSAEQQDLIRRAVASGRVHNAQGAVQEALKKRSRSAQEALSLWVERERRREEILAAIDEAEASLARGQGLVITKSSMRELADDVNRRGRARLRAEEKSGR
jgi:Arc/MetJ-type ribon-helix-helix transcriptional regulator